MKRLLRLRRWWCKKTSHRWANWEDKVIYGFEYKERHCSRCCQIEEDPCVPLSIIVTGTMRQYEKSLKENLTLSTPLLEFLKKEVDEKVVSNVGGVVIK